MNSGTRFLLLAFLWSGWHGSMASFSENRDEENKNKRKRQETTLDGSVGSSAEHEQENKRLSLGIKQQHSQVYAIPTYDATFKHVMADVEVCKSFLQAFIPDENITSIKHLDTHLRPFKEYQNARTLVNQDSSKTVINKINNLMEDGEVTDEKQPEINYVHNGDQFIKGLAQIYGDILESYPKPHRNSQVDLICKVDNSWYVLVELQVAPQDFRDMRALAHAANIYGPQLRSVAGWDNIKKVICVNILGGGYDKFKRPAKTGFSKLTFKDQDNIEIANGIEILQYPLFYDDVKKESLKRDTEETKTAYLEWIDFLEHAYEMKEEDVEKVRTEGVKKAYDLVKTADLPKDVMEQYHLQEEERFKKYAQYTEYLKKKAKKEGEEIGIQRGLEQGIEKASHTIALNFLKLGISAEQVSQGTGLSVEEVENLKKQIQ